MEPGPPPGGITYRHIPNAPPVFSAAASTSVMNDWISGPRHLGCPAGVHAFQGLHLSFEVGAGLYGEGLV